MKRALLVLLVLAGPAAASIAADSIDGQEASMQAAAQLRLSRFDPIVMRLSGTLVGHVFDDELDRIEVDVAPLPPRSSSLHNRTEQDLGQWGDVELRITEIEQAVVILQGDVVGRLDGPWAASATQYEVLDDSHVFEPYDDGRYYSYEVQEAVNLTASQQSSWTLDGPFSLYIWGATLQLRSDAGETTVRTGSWQDVAPADPFVRHWHNAFAVLEGDGRLEWTVSGKASAYASEIHMAAGEHHIAGTGTLQDGPRTYELVGPVGVGGAYRVQHAGGRLELDVVDAPEWQSGVNTQYHVTRSDWFQPTLTAAIVLAACLLAAAAAARFIGSSAAWMQRAYRARDDQRPRRARFYAALACRRDPSSGQAQLLRGQMRAVGPWGALARRDLSHAFRSLKGADRGVAAFELSRLEARRRRAGAAARWLLQAIEDDPTLLGRARREPDFFQVLDDAAFRAIVAENLGLPAPAA